ncbi:hypothetical protein MMC11_006447 [Xylographa trunciseda]|nr:hypothetical protein [Xylographa trunciseda]
MDILLGKVTQQAMNYAIRSGITITANYAFRQSSRLLQNVEDGSVKDELETLQERLRSKINIIAPAIDMIELISARGNTSLESAVTLTQSLRWEIQAISRMMANAADEDDVMAAKSTKAQFKAQSELDAKNIVKQIKKLLAQIEDAVPLINLAITTSGASLSTSLPPTVSPSRLLQASTFVTNGDKEYCMSSARQVQIGPTFTLSMYMLFSGHLRPETEEDIRRSTWKEVIHKARLKLVRVPLSAIYELPTGIPQSSSADSTGANPFGQSNSSSHSPQHMAGEDRADEFGYQIVMIEDLDDGRVHEHEGDEPQPGPYDGVEHAGIREAIPVHEISKIFYADTGKILNIGSGSDSNSPVLLLKRDVNAVPPRRLIQRFTADQDEEYQDQSQHQKVTMARNGDEDHQSLIDSQLEQVHRPEPPIPIEASPSDDSPHLWRLPPNLDPEWLAFEVLTEFADSDDESEPDTIDESSSKPSRTSSLVPQMTSALSNLHLNHISDQNATDSGQLNVLSTSSTPVLRRSAPTVPTVRTSLSLLEMILRLLSLQQFQQTSHLVIPDEFLNFFLAESATTGAASGDERERRRLRDDARRKVGFDPYDESPVKRRGEDYQYRGGQSQAGWHEDAERDRDYEASPTQQIYNGYSSPRWDEGYATHRLNSPSHLDAYNGQVANPETPLLLKDRSQSSRSNTPDGPMPLLSRSYGSDKARNSFPSTPSNGLGAKGRSTNLRSMNLGRTERWGSPLARPTTGMTDEGLGTSPLVVNESVEKD